jgi:glycosyltransferase involved in cell wall biosynthesis
MREATIRELRALLEREERRAAASAGLYAHEEEFQRSPNGISVVVAVHNGAAAMRPLLQSLCSQSLERDKFEVIFSLNGCEDNSAALIETILAGRGMTYTVLESEQAGISRARNRALLLARFRYTTFVDHDDFLSHGYLQTLLHLGDYRSVVVSNILRVNNGCLEPDYAQRVIGAGFTSSHLHAADEIDLCYRAYTLNAIKAAPTYMLTRIQYDERLDHCEDVNYWRDLVHAFTPITVKTPGWSDVYYRCLRPDSASRKHTDLASWAQPRLLILRRIEAAQQRYDPQSPQSRFDHQLAQLIRHDLAERKIPMP